MHYRNIWDGLTIAQNKKRFDHKTLLEVNGLPSIELKYHYPAIDSNLLTKIKEQEIATLHLSDAIIPPSKLLFSPNAPEDLSRKVLALLNDYEGSKRLADSATERALTRFTWHQAQKKLVKVYDRLLA